MKTKHDNLQRDKDLSKLLNASPKVILPHPLWTPIHDAVLIYAIAKHGWIDRENSCLASNDIVEFLLFHLLELNSYEYLFCDRENFGPTFEVLSFQTSSKEKLFQKSISSLKNHETPINVATRVIEFIASFAGSRYSAMSETLLNNNLVRSIMDNRALLIACENGCPYQTQILQEVIIK